MQAFASFQKHQYVALGRGGRRRIEARKWNFERGTFIYSVEGARAGREWSVAQEELVERIRGVEEEVG